MVFKADNVVFTEVTTGLHFDHFERRDAGVFQSVHDAQDWRQASARYGLVRL